jgi:hypothetical protein
MLDDARMTRILLDLKAEDDADDRTLPQAFSFATVVAAAEGEWGLSQDDAGQAVHEWLRDRGEVNAVANPALLMIFRDSWNELVEAHGDTANA